MNDWLYSRHSPYLSPSLLLTDTFSYTFITLSIYTCIPHLPVWLPKTQNLALLLFVCCLNRNRYRATTGDQSMQHCRWTLPRSQTARATRLYLFICLTTWVIPVLTYCLPYDNCIERTTFVAHNSWILLVLLISQWRNYYQLRKLNIQHSRKYFVTQLNSFSSVRLIIHSTKRIANDVRTNLGIKVERKKGCFK